MTFRARPPAVAGVFYPGDAVPLRRMIQLLLREAAPSGKAGDAPSAIIAPHAGYHYSGLTAAHAFSRLSRVRERIGRVVLLGPSHFVAIRGLAVPSVDSFLTPLGPVPVDSEAMTTVARMAQVEENDGAHSREHSIEVELPFLQVVLAGFRLVPLVVGAAAPGEVGEVLEKFWGDPSTLIVISTDLSHYLDYNTAQRMDSRTAEAIESAGRWIEPDEACGRHPLNGLLWLRKRMSLRIERFDLRNSGDTAGPRSSVVGYGSWGLWSRSDAQAGRTAARGND